MVTKKPKGLGRGLEVIDALRDLVIVVDDSYPVRHFDTLAAGMLDEARKAARHARVDIRWIAADATRFTTDERFDAAICLCGGAFGSLRCALIKDLLEAC